MIDAELRQNLESMIKKYTGELDPYGTITEALDFLDQGDVEKYEEFVFMCMCANFLHPDHTNVRWNSWGGPSGVYRARLSLLNCGVELACLNTVREHPFYKTSIVRRPYFYNTLEVHVSARGAKAKLVPCAKDGYRAYYEMLVFFHNERGLYITR